jgi:predicted N-acetyltransferase YhbS
MTFEILPERTEDAPLIDLLLDRTFGYNRRIRTVYRLREGVAPIRALCFSAIDTRGDLLGSIRYWPVVVGGRPALLLGPLAVEPVLQGQGIGRALVRASLDEARAAGHAICIVVGAANYYRPFGFINAAQAGLILPGPVEPERFQVAALTPGALEGVHGLVGSDRTAAFEAGRRRKA